ncbi:NAD-dependent epimerase/dehydratase family protein [Thalassotalea aquiviva]|uniref:NAD-dependent epimerase/dehydratase family protein n=1 Tax=Thalassotalea aquiviva TaxID=3242415 RepID=UPI003529FC8C
MQTILGATGQIGTELAIELNKNYTSQIRLVSRKPKKVNDTDELVRANLLDAAETQNAVAGSNIVYFCAGLPLNTEKWVNQWPVMMQNVINACAHHNAKLVYFDNTYMYPQTSELMTEECRFEPYGQKGKAKAQTATLLLDAIKAKKVQAMICRAPEFYGPNKTQSITNATILYKLLKDKPAKVFVSDSTLRTLIYTPDASKAMALLGNTTDAYNQTWHLPCDDNRLTYKQLIDLASEILQRPCEYKVVKAWQLKLLSIFRKPLREILELLPRYEVDNRFVSDKFKQRFPDFKVTTYRQGLESILRAKKSS